ncbi:MAG: phosphodiester glycosidase family protein [Clostridia bacterium]|nr:phosphodiester glycosidase family protein [Clostridia bacterium]
MKKQLRILSILIATMLVIGILPMNAFAANTGYSDSNGGSDYYNIISEKEWTIAPGVKETELVMNNDDGTRRQVVHTAIIDVNNSFVKVMPGTKGMWPEEGNYGTESTSTQALNAEKLGYGNVVVATNASLSWYTEPYYKENPHLIGEPLGYSILDGKYYANSRRENGTLSSGGVQTVVVVNYDNHPITGEPRPADMPKVWIRGINEPLTGWEEQAIPVLFGYLVKPDANGVPVNQYKEDHGTGIASRTFVGVRADGSLVLAVSDGEQAPYSTGFTNFEMADYMIKMGCVIAANCDGGGSTTFCSQRPGEELKVNCSLSDGGERPTSNTFLIVSTAPSDGVFARATISTDYDYYTPGSSVTFSTLGTDAVGTKVDIPSDIQWQIKEHGMGVIENGVFRSNGTEGKVTAQIFYNGNVVGEKTITIVTPDQLSFEQPIVTIPYSKTAKIPVKATATIDGVSYEIGLGDNDITFTTTNTALGSFDGLNFTAVSEQKAPADITSVVTATLNMGTNPTATVQLNLGKASEVLWDFEGGQADIDVWNVINNRKNAAHWDYYLNLSLADRTNGKVHDGNYSMRLETNGLSSKDSHSEQYAWIRLGVDGEALVLENARSVGFWLYVPEDNIQCWVQGHYKTDSNGDGIFDTDNVVSMMESENVYYNIDESGWHYLSMDISAFSKIALQADKQYDKDPSDGMSGEKGEFFLAIVFHKAINNKLWQENGSINGNYTYYLDNFTVDYSEAVEDRENPVFDKIYLDGSTALVKRDVVTTSNNTLNLSAAVRDKDFKLDANKNEIPLYNASGLNAATAKVYIDGVEVKSTFANGVLSANGIVVPDGYHRVKFEICDNMGNKSVVIRVIKVESGEEKSTINVVPDDSTLDRIHFGSVYWMNLEATAIETIQSVSAVIDLNNVNHWELDHMEIAEGFDATYTIAEETNTATITITRTGTNYDTGAKTLAKLPVRILYFDTDIKTPGYTAQTYWTTYPFWAQDMKMDVDMGLITHIDGKTSTFSNEEFHVDTEMYTSMANMDKAYFSEHGTTHVHTPVALTDKASTCSENGYTDRTFCEVCNSVVDWGTTIPATSHTFKVSGNKIVCDCGRVSNATGLQTVNGKNYYAMNGILLGGWQMIDEEWYLFDEKTFVGVDGEQYSQNAVKFSFDNGRLLDGTWVKVNGKMRYWYGPSYYRKTSPTKSAGERYEIDGNLYIFDKYGYLLTDGVYHYFEPTTKETVYYNCDADGIATLLVGPYNGYFYIDGVMQQNYKLVQSSEGDFYFIDAGHRYAVDKTIYLSSRFVNGHTYSDGTPLSEDYYTFGADGKMIIKNGPSGEYFYANNIRQSNYRLVNNNGDFYFIGDGHKIAKDCTIYLGSRFVDGHTFADGTPLPEDNYTFDSEGKMIIRNGVIGDYLYINNARQTAYQLINYDGDFYFISDGHKIAKDCSVYLGSRFVSGHTYDDGTPLTVGYYIFDEEGKMVILNGPVDRYFYVNNVRQNNYKLVNYEGDYYFIDAGHRLAINREIYLNNKFVSGHTFADGAPLPAGNYSFDEEGKMVIRQGLIGDYLYINNARLNCYQLVNYEDNFYFINDGHKIAKDCRLYLINRFVSGFTYEDGTPLAEGYYTFDGEGKMVGKNGIIGDYFYRNGIRLNAYQLVEYDGNFYFINDGNKIAKNIKLWLSSKFVAGKTYADGSMVEVGYHTFDEDGKMID